MPASTTQPCYPIGCILRPIRKISPRLAFLLFNKTSGTRHRFRTYALVLHPPPKRNQPHEDHPDELRHGILHTVRNPYRPATLLGSPVRVARSIFHHGRRALHLHLAGCAPPHQRPGHSQRNSLALLGGLGLTAAWGLRYPVQMLPVLLFELVWKTIYLLAFALPLWSAHQITPTAAEDIKAVAMVVIFIPIVPWRYVFAQYIRKPSERWK
jgi:hypothetical protein